MTLSITRRQDMDRCVVLHLHGAVDYASAADLRAAISGAICAAPPPSRLVVDLTAVEFVDASGVGTLVVGDRPDTPDFGGTLRS